MAKNHASGDQDVASPEGRAHNTFRHRRVEDGKLEGLQQQLRQLENQVGEILEPVKWWKEGGGGGGKDKLSS